MSRVTAGVLRLGVMLGMAGTVLLWAIGVFAASIAVWQYSALALLTATGLGLSTYGVQRVRRRRI